MTEYKIIPDGLKAYGVEVAFPGRFLSVRGFATEREAAAWIAEQQAHRAWRRRTAQRARSLPTQRRPEPRHKPPRLPLGLGPAHRLGGL